MGSSKVILRPSRPIQCHAESVIPFHVMYIQNLWTHPMSDKELLCVTWTYCIGDNCSATDTAPQVELTAL